MKAQRPNEDGAEGRRPLGSLVSRRQFLAVGIGAVAILTAACSTAPAAAPAASSAAPSSAAPAPASSGAATASSAPASASASVASASVAPASSAAAAPAGKLSDTVVLGFQVNFRSLDPDSSTGQAQYLYPRQVYDTLVSFDNKGQLIPQLAASWNRVDPLTMEFKLRNDVVFHNGDPFTATTVKANVDRVIDPKNIAYIGTLANAVRPIASAEVVNSNTVRIKTKAPDPYILNRMTTIFMVPEKMIASGANLTNQAVGTGAFKVTDFQDNDHLTLEAFDKSWKGPTAIKHAKIVIIPEMSSLIAGLKTGDIDIVYQVAGTQVADLKKQYNVSIVPANACSVMNMFQKAPLADKRIRQAFNYAVDKQAVSNAGSGGISMPAQGQILRPGFEGYDDSIKEYQYDPEKAASLLKAAGADNLQVTLDTATTIKTEAEAVMGYLQKVGVKMSPQILDPAVYIQHLLRKTDANMIHTQSYYWQLRSFDQAGSLYATAAQPFFANAQFKQLYIQQQQELDDTKRTAMIKQMAQLMHDEAPTLFLLWVNDAHAFTKKITTLPTAYDRSIHLWEVQKAA